MNSEHPLQDDLTKLSYEDLEKRLSELTKRYYAARRMNMNESVLYQLDIMLQGLESEKQRRASSQAEISGEVINTDWKDDAKKN